jgi:hypothetical protein
MHIPRRFVFAILLAALAVLAVPRPAEGSVSVSVSFFHERLSPYGRWVVAGRFGDCWVPSGVAAGWAPYVDGQWYWTDYGWTWASADPWGDLPFHYGTWAWADGYGWVWVPGTVWAPAWVTWAYTDAYIGWAPLPPSFVLTAGGYFGNPVVVSQSAYCFVPTRSFVGVSVASVRQPLARNATFLATAARSTQFSVSGGVVHTAGLSPSRIEKATGHRIERVPIASALTKPTTVAAGGLAQASRIAVAAPASERARVIHASSRTAGKPEKATAASTRTAPSHHETSKPAPETKTASARPASHPPAHEQKTASASSAAHPASKHTGVKTPAHAAAAPQHKPETQVAAGESHEHTGAPPPKAHEAAPRAPVKESAPPKDSVHQPQAAPPPHAQASKAPAQKAPAAPPKPKPPEEKKEHGQGA